jgi:hypothetical protein
MACYRAGQQCGRRSFGDAVGIWNPSTTSLRSVPREIYLSRNDRSVQAQQNQLALWFSRAIWFFGMMIMSCLCLPMCAIERHGKRNQSTQMNQSNQLFHIFALQVFLNVY